MASVKPTDAISTPRGKVGGFIYSHQRNGTVTVRGVRTQRAPSSAAVDGPSIGLLVPIADSGPNQWASHAIQRIVERGYERHRATNFMYDARAARGHSRSRFEAHIQSPATREPRASGSGFSAARL